jgi:hypothetical protein
MDNQRLFSGLTFWILPASSLGLPQPIQICSDDLHRSHFLEQSGAADSDSLLSDAKTGAGNAWRMSPFADRSKGTVMCETRPPFPLSPETVQSRRSAPRRTAGILVTQTASALDTAGKAGGATTASVFVGGCQ